MRFQDRSQAGRALADRLAVLGLRDPVVLALPRGGVPVAAEIGAVLGTGIEVFVARKVGLPGHEEYGIAAIAEGSDEVVRTANTAALGLDAEAIAELAARERRELERRVAAYRGGRGLPELTGRDVVLVDDGVATGITVEAALRALRRQRPRRLIVAAGVCAADSARRLGRIADEVVCVMTPEDLVAVGWWYSDFRQVSDQEVADLLRGSPLSERR